MNGSLNGGVRTLVRIEGACLFIAATLAYARFGQGWVVFAVFFLLPDISFLGYLGGPRTGAVTYNMAHSVVGPLMALVVGGLTGSPLCIAGGLIWYAHVGFDRMLGFGLKYADGFGHTHLGTIGRAGLEPDDPARRTVLSRHG